MPDPDGSDEVYWWNVETNETTEVGAEKPDHVVTSSEEGSEEGGEGAGAGEDGEGGASAEEEGELEKDNTGSSSATGGEKEEDQDAAPAEHEKSISTISDKSDKPQQTLEEEYKQDLMSFLATHTGGRMNVKKPQAKATSVLAS